jgi:hypothetical protein
MSRIKMKMLLRESRDNENPYKNLKMEYSMKDNG